MNAKFDVGQKVLIRQDKNPSMSLRDCSVTPYVGQIGEVVNYYYMSPPLGEEFYMYSVRIFAKHKEIALYEDEMEVYRGVLSKVP